MQEGKRLATYARQRGLTVVTPEGTVSELRSAAEKLGLKPKAKTTKGALQTMLLGENLKGLIPKLTYRQQRRLRKKGL